jgi:hypothetical protein
MRATWRTRSWSFPWTRELIGALATAGLAAAAMIASPDGAVAPVEQLVEDIAELPEIPLEIVASVASRGSHLGFDTNIYPGDRAMRAWIDGGSPYEWVGYYLTAPCHKDASWTGKRERLEEMGWGTAVIYVGQQIWPKRTGRALAGKTCSTSFVSAARGTRDAADAIRRTAAEGFPRGTVIFLDIERMETVPQKMRDYYRAWTKAVLADGRYRPGFYAHEHNARRIHADVNAVFRQAGATFEPPMWLAGNSHRFSARKKPSEIGHEFAAVWQGLLDVVRTHNGVRLPIDVNVAAVPSPSSHVNEYMGQ